MSRPPLEVADLIRAAGAAFIERNRQWIRWRHVKVLLAIARCRTAALGGHLDECTRCEHRTAISYNSCRDPSAETLLEVARDPRHLSAEIGFFSVLHTWNQKLKLHPHVHCVVPAGGLSLDHTRWIKSRSRFFLSIKVLRRLFAASSSPVSSRRSRAADCASVETWQPSLSPKPSRLGCGCFFEKTGWSTRNVP